MPLRVRNFWCPATLCRYPIPTLHHVLYSCAPTEDEDTESTRHFLSLDPIGKADLIIEVLAKRQRHQNSGTKVPNDNTAVAQTPGPTGTSPHVNGGGASETTDVDVHTSNSEESSCHGATQQDAVSYTTDGESTREASTPLPTSPTQELKKLIAKVLKTISKHTKSLQFIGVNNF